MDSLQLDVIVSHYPPLSYLLSIGCLERGFSPTAYEASGSVGGVWRSNYDSLYTNSCKELMTLSDFPFPFETKGTFPSRGEVCKYYESYMAHFSLEQHIHFNTTVLSVEKHGNQWRVVTDKQGEQLFDKLMLCTGKFWDKKLPDWAKTLQQTTHSCDYKNPANYLGKRVLIVGIWNSALDIALELAKEDRVAEGERVIFGRRTLMDA